MASKRTATSELNHDNWNNEDEPEDAGTFVTAPQDVMEKRVMRTAKRRLAGGEGSAKNAFNAFTGFKATPPSTTTAFSFLKSNSTPSIATSQPSSIFSNLTSSNGSTKTPENGLSTSSMPSVNVEKIPENPPKAHPQAKNERIFKESSEYFAKLKGLNESVAQWIKTHVDANPFCILTPIFRDYERYLKEIEAKREIETEKLKELEKKACDNGKSSVTFGDSPKKASEAKTDSPFTSKPSSTPATSSGTIFGSLTSGKSIFGNSDGKNVFGKESNPFLNKSKDSGEKNEEKEEKLEGKSLTFPQTNPAIFSFGQNSDTGTSSASFSFGSGKPFSFGNNAVAPQNSETKDDEDKEDDEEPPKAEVKPITEEGAIFEQRCKVFFKKDKVYSDRGVGVLFLKPTPNGKTQMIVRAENSLGNLLLNTLLTESVRTQRMNKNTVMVVCLPLPDSQPPPTPVLLRVKASEDADKLLESLENNKK